MYKFSFKVKHKNCSETTLSEKFPKHHITVVDIQSTHQKQKQYFYYITGNQNQFDALISFIKQSKGYNIVKEVERSERTLLLLVVLYQKSYIQNVIQKYNGFFIDLHTVFGGYEYWHIGTVSRDSINSMLRELKQMGEIKVISVGEIEFAHSLLSKQQKNVLLYAYEQGYYETPRKTTVSSIARALKLSHGTVGEHLQKAENKLIQSIAKRL